MANEEPSPSAPARTLVKSQRKGRNRSYLFHKSAKLAREFLRLHATPKGKMQRCKKGVIDEFLASKGWDSSKASKDHFRRVLKAVRNEPIVTAGGVSRDRVPKDLRRRRVGKQGAHLVKALVLREQLFAWFCSVRGRIKGRLPTQVLRSKAMSLRLQCMVAATSAGMQASVPKIAWAN